jgi:hypothetical protein
MKTGDVAELIGSADTAFPYTVNLITPGDRREASVDELC